MEGSGFPVAKQVRVTLVPSLMVISLEMSYIFGGTEMTKHVVVRKIHKTSVELHMINFMILYNKAVVVKCTHGSWSPLKRDSRDPQDSPRVFCSLVGFIFL